MDAIKISPEHKKVRLMTEGNIARQLFFFAVPLIFGNLLQQLYNTADSIIVGNYVGSNALAAVGSSTAIISLLIAFGQGASVGAGVVVAQYLGAKDRKNIHLAVHTSLAIAILLGIGLSVTGIFMTKPLLYWMDTPEDVFKDSAIYLRIYFGGAVFNIIYNMASGILNAVGNSRRSLLYLGSASLTNIVLDLVFVKMFQLGVTGAAIATDISQLVSSVLAIRYLVSVQDDYRVILKNIRIQRKMAAHVIQVGLPTGIQNMVISLSNVLIQSSVNGFGVEAMAGFGAYMKIDGFNILPVTSFSMAVTTFTGQNSGAGKYDRVKKGMWTTLVMCCLYTIATGVLLLVFSNPLMRMFTDNPEVIDYGKSAMRYFCPFYFVLSILHSLAGAVRGTGKTIPPMAILLISLCLFRILWVRLVLPVFHTITGIYILYPISWIIGTFLMILYTWKGHWLPYKNI